MADLAARGYTGVLHTFSENDLAYYRDTMREIVDASHARRPDGAGDPVGARPHVRRRGREPLASPSIPRSARCSTTAGASRRRASTARRTARSARSGPTGCSSAASTRVFWDEPAWVVPAHVGIDDPSAGAAAARTAPSASAAPLPARARRRGAGVPRGVGRRLPARGGRARRRARRREHDLPAAGDRGRARHLRLERSSRRCPGSRRSRPIRTGSTGTRRPGRSCAASRGCCARRATATASPRSSGCRASA